MLLLSKCHHLPSSTERMFVDEDPDCHERNGQSPQLQDVVLDVSWSASSYSFHFVTSSNSYICLHEAHARCRLQTIGELA